MALDVARILLRPTTELATTDIASHALSALEKSSIRFSIPYFENCQLHLMASLIYLGCIFNDINVTSGKYIWLEGGVRHKQLVLLKELREILGDSQHSNAKFFVFLF